MSEALGMDFVENGSSDSIRPELSAAFRHRVETHLLEALDSGPVRALGRKAWERIRSKGIKLAARRKSRR